MSQINRKKILIIGLGLNDGGVGTARFFLKRMADVTVTDLKSRKELLPSIKKLHIFIKQCKKKCGRLKLVLGRHRIFDFKNADLIIQGPGVPNSSPFLAYARKNKIPIDTDMGIFFENCPAPIIGITGSKGKSTTASLIYLILRQKFKDTILAGNIGKSPLDFIDRIKPATKVILELSSWQLEGLSKHKKSPWLAVVTNVFKEHLNRYKNFRHYIRAKSLIFKYQNKNDFLILSSQARAVFKNDLNRIKSKVIVADSVSLRSLGISNQGHRLLGRHNIENAYLAYKAASICSLPKKLIIKGFLAFKGLEGRQEKIAEIDGVSYYNDTTATMPDAVIAALKTIKVFGKGRIILIAGGTDKKLDFSDMAHEILKQVRVLILLPGSATDKIKKELKAGLKNKLIMIDAGSMQAAVESANRIASKRDTVILSPGAASFGLFQNEFDRGRQFVKEVRKIKSLIRR